MNALVTRRGLLQASTITLGAAMLPVGIAGAVAAAAPTAALPTVFDPAAFVDELTAAGYRVTACRPALWRDERPRAPSYFITPPRGRGFSSAYSAVMVKWGHAMDACPDHIERVVAHVFGQLGRDAA